MKTMIIKVVVVVVFAGAFTLKNFTNFVDKAYGTEVSLRTQARNLVREVKAYKDRVKAFDVTIAREDITHEERADAMNRKHTYIDKYAQALLDKINAYIQAAKDAHEEDLSDIEAKLQPTIDALTASINGQEELAARAVAEDGVQIVQILDDLKDPETCPTEPKPTTKEPKKPAVSESDDADKYIEAALWAEILENLEPDFAADLSREELKELKTDITKAVAEFVENYFAQYQARIGNPLAFIDSRDDKDQRLYYNPDRQLQKVTRKIKELEAALKVEGLSTVDANKLRLELFTAKQLKSYFEKYIQGINTSSHGEGEEGVSVPSSGIDQETMTMLMLLNSQGMLSAEEMQMLLMGGGQAQAKPKTGFGIKLGSTPWGGVDVGFDYNGEDHGMSMDGTFGNTYRGFPGVLPGTMPFNPADPYQDPSQWFRR